MGRLADDAVVPGLIIMEAVMGSQSQGLATAESDEDVHGVYVSPTLDLLSLKPPADSVVLTDPDFSYHEIGKFVRLAAACNPTILEQLWVGKYTFMDDTGARLLCIRDSFLSAPKIRDAYLGFAKQQLNWAAKHTDHKRYHKALRHTFRLLEQGRELLCTGNLTVKVKDPERLRSITLRPIEQLQREFMEVEGKMMKNYASSSLPDSPDLDKIEALLRHVRKEHVA